LLAATQRLQSTATQTIAIHQTRLNRASARLEALSPLAVLSRGYALVYASDGTLLRSSAGTSPGDTIRARLAQGALEATVTNSNIQPISNEPNATETRSS
jgi:exodeoxyribonuclease VII large subunit